MAKLSSRASLAVPLGYIQQGVPPREIRDHSLLIMDVKRFNVSFIYFAKSFKFFRTIKIYITRDKVLWSMVSKAAAKIGKL